MAVYNYALSLAPHAVDVLLKRASLWFEKEEMAKAFEDFDAALKIDDTHPDIYCQRGQLHMLRNEVAKALTDLRKAKQLDGESMLTYIQLAMGLFRNGQHSEARRTFEEAEKKFPHSAEVLNYHGELLVEAGELEKASASFRRAIEASNGEFALPHVNNGVIELHTKGDMEAAVAHCKKALEVDPLCETAHLHMAHLCLQQDKLQEAVEAYDKAIGMMRVKQELIECLSMREGAAAQLALLSEQREVYGPAIERQKARAMQMQR